MRIQKRSLNWFPKQSLYKQVQTMQLKQRYYAGKAQESFQALANNLSTARDNQVSGLAELAAKAALRRVNKNV
jgi:hypothetical protein